MLWIVPVVAAIVGIVFGILAGVRAAEGQLYQYPTWFTFIR